VLLVLLGALARTVRGAARSRCRSTIRSACAARSACGSATRTLARAQREGSPRRATPSARATPRQREHDRALRRRARDASSLACRAGATSSRSRAILQTSESEDIVATHFAEQEVTPQRGAHVRLSFDFAPRACPVEVRVAWDRRTVEEARIARYGAPARCGSRAAGAVLARPRHAPILAGSTDRVAEATLAIESSSRACS
jgi:hypothetical protein